MGQQYYANIFYQNTTASFPSISKAKAKAITFKAKAKDFTP